MPYPDELFASAVVLYQASPESQATLRRAVSTAYYALFHFLIEVACKNWTRPEQRPALARMFEHARMANASNSRVGKHKNAAAGSAEFRLYLVPFFNFTKSVTKPTTICQARSPQKTSN